MFLAGAVCVLGTGVASAANSGTTENSETKRTTSEKTLEYQIKAAFLYNFTKYVKWPDSAFADSKSPLIVAVVGKDPFGPALDKACGGKTGNGRKIVVKRFATVNKLGPCHILFVPQTEAGSVEIIARRYAGTSALIVGESTDFAAEYGLVNFYIEKKKVHFEVNISAVKREKLAISSQLLKLARIVKEKK